MPAGRVELPIKAYESFVMPFNYAGIAKNITQNLEKQKLSDNKNIWYLKISAYADFLGNGENNLRISTIYDNISL